MRKRILIATLLSVVFTSANAETKICGTAPIHGLIAVADDSSMPVQSDKLFIELDHSNGELCDVS